MISSHKWFWENYFGMGETWIFCRMW